MAYHKWTKAGTFQAKAKAIEQSSTKAMAIASIRKEEGQTNMNFLDDILDSPFGA